MIVRCIKLIIAILDYVIAFSIAFSNPNRNKYETDSVTAAILMVLNGMMLFL